MSVLALVAAMVRVHHCVWNASAMMHDMLHRFLGLFLAAADPLELHSSARSRSVQEGHRDKARASGEGIFCAQAKYSRYPLSCNHRNQRFTASMAGCVVTNTCQFCSNQNVGKLLSIPTIVREVLSVTISLMTWGLQN